MYLGTQNEARDDDDYRAMAQLGIRHVCSDPAGNPHGWTIDDLKRHQDRLGRFGLSLDMVQLPLELAAPRGAAKPGHPPRRARP